MLTEADEVAMKTSAPAARAASSTFTAPSRLTAVMRWYSSLLRSWGRTEAAVWKTVRGLSATDAGHGLEKAASTEARELISALITSLPAAAVSMSRRLSGTKSTTRMLSGGSPRCSSCKTMSPPTRPTDNHIQEKISASSKPKPLRCLTRRLD